MRLGTLLNRPLNGAIREILAGNDDSNRSIDEIDESIWFSFISSREQEFGDARQEIDRCLRLQRFEAFRAESVESGSAASHLVTAGLISIDRVLAKAIRLCDLYLLLVGAEYGDPPSWAPNMSATAWEFEIASTRRKRFLVKCPPGTPAIIIVVNVCDEKIDERQKTFRDGLMKRYFCIFADRHEAVVKIAKLVGFVRRDLVWSNLLWLAGSALLFLGSTAWLSWSLVHDLQASFGVWVLWISAIVNFLRSVFPGRPVIGQS